MCHTTPFEAAREASRFGVTTWITYNISAVCEPALTDGDVLAEPWSIAAKEGLVIYFRGTPVFSGPPPDLLERMVDYVLHALAALAQLVMRSGITLLIQTCFQYLDNPEQTNNRFICTGSAGPASDEVKYRTAQLEPLRRLIRILLIRL
jgi:hypothetical protein